jgi:hypothetical protein
MRVIATFVILVVSGFVLPASAQDGAKVARGAVQAGKELEGHIAKIAAAKGRFDLSAAPAAPLFSKVFDTRTLRSLSPSAGADLPWLSEWLGASGNVYMAIINFGTDPKSETYLQGVQANVERYEDEITSAIDFMLRLFPRVSNSAAAYAKSLTEAERNQPKRQKGLENIRDGYMKSVSGAIAFAGGDLKPANARTVSLVLRETVPDWGQVASPEQRTELSDLLSQAQEAVKDPDAHADLAAAAQALSAIK